MNWNTPDTPKAWSTPDRPLTALVDSYAEDRAEVPRNHYGQYLIPSADGRQPSNSKGRPRVSTLAKVGADTSLLEKRAVRLVTAGIAKDPAINAEAMKAEALEDDTREKRDALQKVAASAFAAAGGHDRANRGTRIHQLVEDIKRGKDPQVPDELRADVDAYFAVLQKHGLEFMPKFMERVVLCPYDFGGAIDDIMRRWNADTEMYEYVVVDTKTGASLDFSKLPILTQLWMYANALCFFVTTYMGRDKDGKINEVRGYQEDMPLELRRDTAVIIHLDGLGAAHYYEVNIGGHGRVVAAQIELKRADAEAGHLFRLVGSVTPDPFVKQFKATGGVVDPELVPVIGEGGYTAMIKRDFGDRATPAMREQAAAADARSYSEGAPEITAAAAAGAQIAATVLDGEGKPLGPLADKSKKERGCSVCGRKGHKSTSPRCLKDKDPAKQVTVTVSGVLAGAHELHAAITQAMDDGPSPSDMVAAIDAAAAPGRNDDPDDGVSAQELLDQARAQEAGQELPSGAVAILSGDPVQVEQAWSGPGGAEAEKVTALAAAALVAEPVGPYAPTREQAIAPPYCGPHAHAGPCGWSTRPDGSTICALSGKPSRMVWELQQSTLLAISQYHDPAVLLTFRQAEQAANRWTPEHEAACFTRYQELTVPRG